MVSRYLGGVSVVVSRVSRRRCLGGVSAVSWWCLGVLVVSRWYLGGVSVSWWCLGGVSVVSQWCLGGAVSLSDVLTSFGLQTLLWKHHSACC